MKKILMIAILILTTSAFCDENGFYISGGYSQSLTGTTPVGDLSMGLSFKPFDNYDIQIGIDYLHFQIAPTDRFQTVSDESLFQLPFILLALPLTMIPSADKSQDMNHPQIITRYFYILGGIGFLLHGSLYFPIVPNNCFGFINKQRFITEILTKGIHLESFTFQDDIGLRFQLKPEGHYGFFIDGGFRFEKNFSRDFEKKWFVQVALIGER